MHITEIIAAIDQYKSEGQDMNAVVAAAQSMADTGKTPLGLNQWKLTDKPRMEEFNEDNRIVDEQLRQLTADKASYTKLDGLNLDLYAGETLISGNVIRVVGLLIGGLKVIKALVPYTVSGASGALVLRGIPAASMGQNAASYSIEGTSAPIMGTFYVSGLNAQLIDPATSGPLNTSKVGTSGSLIVDLSYV